MGIPGIYKEIGAGTRIALAKLAAQKFEQSGRPLRIAIDTAIWLVQIQSAKGGTNPALRTFYYRLLRLMSLSIDPLFVFDGPKKPKFKRNKHTSTNVATVPEFLAKQLLKQFGFPFHEAPGEAEAECALLQRLGIVDMVLSEDVDTLMFGSRMTIRNFSAEAKAKTATHVNLHDSERTKAGPSGLDREGMILVAMMSGGDYAPEGIRDCGPKVACEAARAGYGKGLCEAMDDKRKLEEWKLDLAEELRTNKSKFFRTKHPGIEIPNSWPRLDILKLYVSPATSSSAALERLRQNLSWDGDIDIVGLRKFTSEAFKWQGKTGAKHFIRNIAQPMLVRKLRLRGKMAAAEMASQKTTHQLEKEEGEIVVKIHGRRAHVSTDQMEELRVSVVPFKLVPIDLDAEEEDEEDSVADLEAEEVIAPDGEEGTAKRPSQYNPEEPERHWVLNMLAAYGVPIKVEDWREAQRKKNAPKEPNANKPRTKTAKKQATNNGMPEGAIDRYTRISKSTAGPSQKATRAKSPSVDRLDLSGPGDEPAQRSGSIRPAKETTKPVERTASTPHFVNLCSSPPVPEPKNSQSFPTLDEHYLSPNVTKRAKSLRRTQSANDSVPEGREFLPELRTKKPAPSNSRSQRNAAPLVEMSPSKHQVSIEESVRPQKKPSATLPPLDGVEQIDLTSSPAVPCPMLKTNVERSTQHISSRGRETLSPTSDNPVSHRTAKEPSTAKFSTTRSSSPKSPGTRSKKSATRHVFPRMAQSPHIDRMFGSSKVSKEMPKKRAIKLRGSLDGTWTYVDRDKEHLNLIGSTQCSTGASGAPKGTTKSAQPRRKAWRESGVEMLDLTDV